MKRWYLLLFVLSSGLVNGQDIHFSQFYNSPLNINPANTGVFNGDQRIHAGYRTQWSNIVPWSTFTAAYDRKFISKCCPDPKAYWSGGILINHDRVSEFAKLTLNNINLTASYTLRIDSSNVLSFGGLFGVASRAFDEDQLVWDKQWDGREFGNGPSGENFNSDRINFFETALGINYRWQKSARTKVDLGVGVYHFIEPTVTFYDNNELTLSRRMSLSAVGHFYLTEGVNLQINGLAQFQGGYDEFIIGGLAQLYLKRDPGKHLQLHAGLGYRTSRSLFPIVAVQFNRFYGAISYDIDMTDINELKPVRPNTLELHFIYRIGSPKWGKGGCPIY